MQKINLIGCIGQDATVNHEKNFSVLNFSLAVNLRYKDGVEWKEKPIWYRCSLWRKPEQLDKIKEHLKKGCKIYCSGDFEASLYGDKIQTTVIIENYELLTFKEKA